MNYRSERKLRRRIAARYEPERREMQERFRRVEGLLVEVDAMCGMRGVA